MSKKREHYRIRIISVTGEYSKQQTKWMKRILGKQRLVYNTSKGFHVSGSDYYIQKQDFKIITEHNTKAAKKSQYIRIAIVEPKFVFDRVGSEGIVIKGHRVHMGSMRYQTFKKRGCTCIKCYREGVFFALEKFKHEKALDRAHFNLYGIDKNTGKEFMMTKDHRIPKSKGGSEALSNMDTMCASCNTKKGNTI